MKCYLRRQICVVSLLLLLITLSFGQVLDIDKVKRLVGKELKGAFGDKVQVVNIYVYLRKPVRYKGIEKINLSVREGNPRGSVHLYIKTEKGIRRITATLDLKWKCEVLIALEDMERGERLYPWFFSFENIYMERCPQAVLDNTEELMNYVALRDIKKGSILKKSFLKKEPLIRRGEEVNVIFRSGNLEISFSGKALDTGFYGDIIRVKSLNTGKILRGRVISEGSVLIK